jgi:hypothetical protein
MSLPPSPPRAALKTSPDEALSKVLIDGEGWQLVVEGMGFITPADAEGNFCFFDLGKGTGIQRIRATASYDLHREHAEVQRPEIRLTRLYACTQGPKAGGALKCPPEGDHAGG